MGGELIEAQHVARYRLAAQQTLGRTVLDAGCGVGWGAALLLDAGAESVVGIDIAHEAVDDARASVPGARFVVGDLREIPCADDAFELVTCFEAIEHVVEPTRALDELARVVAPSGVVLVSSPNPHVYPAGNPFHVHEFTPDELVRELSKRFSRTCLWRQYDLAASLILESQPVTRDDPIENVARSVVDLVDDHDMYSVVIATNGELPQYEPISLFAPQTEVKALRAMYEDVARRHELLHDEHVAMGEELRRACVELETARHAADRAMTLEREVEGMRASKSWRLTAPLRWLNATLRAPKRPDDL
jgi:ubiquinone/menaquinone biosynthesis C-methylase UbiE